MYDLAIGDFTSAGVFPVRMASELVRSERVLYLSGWTNKPHAPNFSRLKSIHYVAVTAVLRFL